MTAFLERNLPLRVAVSPPPWTSNFPTRSRSSPAPPGGIGFAIAARLAAEGARVILNGRTEPAVAAAAAELRAAHSAAKVETFAGDLADAAVAEQLVHRFPTVDLLINNLGIFEPKPFEQIPDEDWRRFFDVNVLSGVRLSRAYLPGMRQRNWGRVVFISSESAIQIPVEMIHYGMTKTAQLAISRGLAESCAGTGITVNSVLPGPTRSAGVDEFVAQLSGDKPFAEFEQEFFAHVRPTSLLKRFETPAEIADLVAFVCSPLASGINGAVLLVEDHEDTAEALTLRLRREGLVVTCVHCVAAAKQATAQHTFDLLVTDPGLPDGDGYAVFAALRERHSIPALAMSGYGTEEDLRKTRAAGFSAHLVKPVSVTELLEEMRKLPSLAPR